MDQIFAIIMLVEYLRKDKKLSAAFMNLRESI